jgi:hypothetical protein
MDSRECRSLTEAQFAALGLNRLAYVKPVRGDDGDIVYRVHAAEGSMIGELGDRAIAEAAIREHDMEPLSVH